MSETLSALSERGIRLKLNNIFRSSILDSKPFIPKNAANRLVYWLLSLRLTRAEKEVASKMTKEIIMEYERRLRLLGEEIEQEAFKRYGG